MCVLRGLRTATTTLYTDSPSAEIATLVPSESILQLHTAALKNLILQLAGCTPLQQEPSKREDESQEEVTVTRHPLSAHEMIFDRSTNTIISIENKMLEPSLSFSSSSPDAKVTPQQAWYAQMMLQKLGPFAPRP